MRDLFEELYADQSLPAGLEDKILDSYDAIKMVSDIFDLFTHTFALCQGQLLLDVEKTLGRDGPSRV